MKQQGYYFEVGKRGDDIFAHIWREGEDTSRPPVKSFYSAQNGDDGWRTVSKLAAKWIEKNGRMVGCWR